MRTEEWRKIEELLEAALDLDGDGRRRFLDEACAGAPELRREVESLLDCEERADGFLAAPAFAFAADLFADGDGPEAQAGRRIGPYRVISEVGRGGMGTVYLAERADELYEKLVALKVVRRGMDTEDILHRFRNERQILASLEHPNIARLFDGGTTDDGLPYLVMEYVEGTPITSYCAEKRLTIEERLRIFRSVCGAVSYAHQHLVIHRDIKPSNILITEEGAPKLLDFGIAKVLDGGRRELAERTRTGWRVFTPDYASPEQVRGEKLTTASDIYTLGVILYVLLTGTRPYRLKRRSPEELARAVCEEEPERPSTAVSRTVEVTCGGAKKTAKLTPEAVSAVREGGPERLRRRLRGDLDNIVLMALRKEPERRYRSVEQFSEDIRRHLEGLPVVAHQDTFWYRAGKFIRRHRVSVTAATFIALSLIAGMALSLWQARIAREQTRRAERVNTFMRNIFLLANPRFNSPGRDLKGGQMSVLELLDEASHRIDTEFADQPADCAELHHTLGDTFLVLNRFDEAEANFRSAFELSRQVYGERHPKVAQELYYLAATAEAKDEASEADKLFREAIRMMRETDGENANLPYMLHDYGALRLRNYGDVEGAEQLYRQSLALFRRKYGEDHVVVVVISFNSDLGELAEMRNDLDGAEALYRETIRRFEGLAAATHQDYQTEINRADVSLARIMLRRGRYEEGEASLRAVLSRVDESKAEYKVLTKEIYDSLARLHDRRGEYATAEAEWRHVLDPQRASVPDGHPALIGPLCQLSAVLSKEGKRAEALALYQEAREIYDRREGPSFETDLFKTWLGEALTGLGRYAEAEGLLEESYADLRGRVGEQNFYTTEARRVLRELSEARREAARAAPVQ